MVKNNNKTSRTVYIMGRGHSGSTAIDAIIGNSVDIESVGELVSGLDRYPDEVVATGEKISESDYWKSVFSAVEKTTGKDIEKVCRILTSQANLKNFIKTLISSKSQNWVKELLVCNRSLFKAISCVSGKKMVLESSKEFTRAVFLLRFLPEVKVIHLIKDPSEVIFSYYNRVKSREYIKILRKRIPIKNFFAQITGLVFVALSWNLGFLLGYALKKFYPNRILTVSFNSVQKEPEIEINRIGRFLGADLQDVADAIKNKKLLNIGNNVGGNGMRFSKTFIFRCDNKGKKSRKEIPCKIRLIGSFFCGPLLLVSYLINIRNEF